MRKVILILTLFIGVSCEEVIDMELQTADIDLVVVEGLITNELKQHYVRLSKPNKEPNQPSSPISGASIQVRVQNRTLVFREAPAGSGIYLSEDEFRGVAGVGYLLQIRIGNRNYAGSTVMTPVQPLRPINRAVAKLDNGNYIMRQVGEPDPSMTRVYLDWSLTDSCNPGEKCNALQTFYTLSSIDVNQYFSPEQEVIEFPSRSTIIRRKLSLSRDHQVFIRAVLNETLWRGGAFDVQQGNIPTNMSEGAIGYFAAATVVADTTVVP